MAQKAQTHRARGLRAKVNNPLLPRQQETERVKETGSTSKELSKNKKDGQYSKHGLKSSTELARMACNLALKVRQP